MWFGWEWQHNKMIFRVVYVGGDGVYRHVQQYFSYIVEVSLIGGGNRSIRRKPQTCRNLLTYNFITY